MTTGTSTYDGLAVPLKGESNIIQQDPTVDILTITGSTGQTGDFMVMENSTGAELYVFSALATSAANGLTISPYSTGAIAAGSGAVGCAFLVTPAAAANINAAFAYASGSQTGACNYLIAADGSKAPTYFLGVSASVGPGLGAIVANGFLDDSLKLNTFTCDHPFIGLKCIAGSVAFYLLGAHATGIT